MAKERRLTKKQRQLVEDHLKLVPIIARNVGRSLPACITRDELEGIGYLALSRAAATYAVSRGAFTTWASIRIKGAMIDANKGRYWPRPVPQTLALHDVQTGNLDPSPEEKLIAHHTRRSLSDRLARALAKLNERELAYLELREAGLTLGEIAEQEGVSVMVAFRVLKKATIKLRADLADLQPRRRNGS